MKVGKQEFFLVIGPYVLLIEFASFQAECQIEIYLLAGEMKSPLLTLSLPWHKCKKLSQKIGGMYGCMCILFDADKWLSRAAKKPAQSAPGLYQIQTTQSKNKTKSCTIIQTGITIKKWREKNANLFKATVILPSSSPSLLGCSLVTTSVLPATVCVL